MILNIGDDKEIWVMIYKDEDTDTAPWKRWTSTDRPSEIALKSFREQGMHRLEVFGKCTISMLDLIEFKSAK